MAMNRKTSLFLSASLIGLSAVVPGSAAAQQAAQQRAGIEEIVVIGTNIRSSLLAEEQATPIAVYTGLELASSGSDSLNDFLMKDPAFTAPNGGQDGRSQGGSARQSLNLRGLGDRYTLTLVNGRRLDANSPGNLLLIPTGAIERIEILKAGASAIYGSDAVAGAVNIVLKKSDEGAWVQGGYGNVTEGSALTRNIAASMGSNSERSRMFFAASYYKRDHLNEDERDITRDDDMRPYGGFDSRSGNTVPARFTIPGRGSIILNTDLFGPGTYSMNPNDYRPYVAERDLFERPGSAVADSERKQFYVSGEYDIGESGVTVFSEGMIAFLKGEGINSTKIARIDDPRIGGVPATNPWNPFGITVGATSAFPLRIMEKGPLRFAIDSRVARLLAGARATFGEIEVESALTYYETRSANSSPVHISVSGLRAALYRPGPDAFNPFCNICNTDAQLAGVLVDAENNRQYTRAKMVDVKASGPLFDLPTGTVQFAFGAEHRREDYDQTADAIHVRGDLADSGILEPKDLGRSLTAVFGEFRVPLMSGSRTESPLELTVAARHEHYSDFGNTFRPLTALRWEAIPDQLTLRASYGKSFRAPFLEEVSPTFATSQIVLIDPLNNQPVEVEARRGGNPDLDPETGETINIGGFWTPNAVPDLRLTLDYYHINQTGLVISPSPQLIFNGLAPGQVFRDGRAQGANEDILIVGPLANAAGRKVRGLDFGSVYTMPDTAYGTFNFDLSANYLLKFKIDTAVGLGFINYAGEYSLAEGNNGVRALPRWKGKLGANWSLDAFGAAVGVNYLGSYLQERVTATTPPFSPANPGKVRSHVTMDLQTSYEFGLSGLAGRDDEAVKLTVGVENVFNRQPPFVRAQNGLDRNVYDVRGRYVYANVGVRF